MLKDIAVIHTDNENASCELLYLDGSRELLAEPAESLFNRWCLSYGSTLEGRTDAVRRLTGIRTKAPLLIRERDVLLFFPLRSLYTEGENYWINDNQLAAVLPERRTSAHLVFMNGFQLEIPYDIRIIRRQQDICRKLRDVLANANKEL